MSIIFHKAKNQLTQQLPFVVYRKPNARMIQAFFMKETTPIQTNFNEAGFCFFPFDHQNKDYFFPQSQSDYRVENHPESTDENYSSTIEVPENEDEKRRYIQLLAESIHELKNGAFQKIVLSRPIPVTIENIDALQVFQRLLMTYPEAMVYIWFHPNEGIWMGATPETLASVSHQMLTTMSLAGTRTYHPTQPPSWADKEREEQQFVTDYIVKTLQAYSQQVETSEVSSKRAGNLVHLHTAISAKIDAADLQKILKDLHPTPAVCGLPTEKAKKYLQEKEGYPRSFYTGFLGEVNCSFYKATAKTQRNQEVRAIRPQTKQTHLYVNLRCMHIIGAHCTLYVGGGVTAASNATDEWKETRYKSETLLKVL